MVAARHLVEMYLSSIPRTSEDRHCNRLRFSGCPRLMGMSTKKRAFVACGCKQVQVTHPPPPPPARCALVEDDSTLLPQYRSQEG